MSNNLKIKDLVTIGIFFVIYLVVMFALGMIGMVPILFMFYPFLLGIVAGTIIMLFMAKVPKPWALFILGILPSVLMVAMGHSYIIFVFALIFMIIAEIIFRKGEFKSFKHNAIAYGFFSICIVGGHMEMLLARGRYQEIHVNAGMTPEFFDKLEKLISWPNVGLVILGAFVGGIIGAYIGKAMLKKHFEKAGIV